MRILFVTHNIPRVAGDAAGSFILRLAIALRDLGARVDVLAPGGSGLAPHEAIEGIEIRRVPYGRPDQMTLAHTGTMADAVRSSWGGRVALLRLLRALRREAARLVAQARAAGAPYDVVHAHWWFPAGLALWRARLAGAPPQVITMHGSDVRLARAVRPAHPLMRAVLRAATVRTAVSSWLADEASQIVPGAEIRVGPMPIDMRLFTDEASTDPPPGTATGQAAADEAHAQRNDLLFVGRLNRQKGLQDLLDAMACEPLSTRRVPVVHLDVIGDGPDRPRLEAHARAIGIADRIRWHGALPQPRLVPFYRRAAVVVVPSREEGLGLVAVEAQLCRAPVVAYASGGLPDVVQPGAGGALVPVGDVRALAAAIGELLEDPDRRDRAGAIAQAAMRSRFAPEAVGTQYLGWYREAIAMRAGRLATAAA